MEKIENHGKYSTFVLEPAQELDCLTARDTDTGVSITFRVHEFNDEASKRVYVPVSRTMKEAEQRTAALQALGFWVCKKHRDMCFIDKQDFRDQFGAHLRQCRQAKGLTIEQLSARSGITQSNICKTETGKYNPRIDSLVRIADALDMQIKLVPLED